jgi:cytochrome P450
VRPLLRSRFFEVMGGKPVVDNNRLIDYANAQVNARNKDEGNEKGTHTGRIDFLSHLIDAQDKKTGWKPTPAYLDTEALNMINAGADPYSSVLAGLLFYLVHNKDVLQKVTKEIR